MIENAYAQVKGLCDEQLLKERQMPSGTMPMYLVITEMEQRAAIRKQQQQPAPQGNVADQTTDAFRKEVEESSRKQMAESGIGAIHSPTLTAASGGLVAFDGGGPVRHLQGKAPEGQLINEESTSRFGRALEDLKNRIDIGSMFEFNQEKNAKEYARNNPQVILRGEAAQANPGFFESLTPSQTAAREAKAEELFAQANALRGINIGKPKSEELKTIPRLPDAPEDTQIRPYSGVDNIPIPDDAGMDIDLNAPSKAAAPAAPVRATRPPAKPTISSQDMLRADLDKLGLGPKTAEQTAIDEANTRKRIEEKEAFLEKKFPNPNAEYSAEVAAKRAQLKDKEHSDFWTTILGAGLKGASEAKSTPGIAGVIQSLSGTGANAVEGIQKLAIERQKRDDLLMQAQQQMAQANQARQLGFLDRANAYELAAQLKERDGKALGLQIAQIQNQARVTNVMLDQAAEGLKIQRAQLAKPSTFAETLAAQKNPENRAVLQDIEYRKSLDSYMARLPAAYKAASGMDIESNPEKYQAFVNDMVKNYRTTFQAGLNGINIPPKTPG
jgi:hypothetical protein